MADRRPIAISFVVLTIAILVFAASFFVGENGFWNSSSRSSHSLSSASPDMERGSIDGESKLPQDIVLLNASADGEVMGEVICGNCTYETGDACNVMIYDEVAKHLVTVLPNEHYDELNALMGST